jgi:TonB family protein
VDFTAFSADLVQAVRRNWYAQIPVEAKQKTGTGGSPAKGKVVVRFRIQRDGRLGSVPIVEVSSGNKPLDDAALSAVRNSAPFKHLPDSFKGPEIELRLGFFYNVPMTALNP